MSDKCRTLWAVILCLLPGCVSAGDVAATNFDARVDAPEHLSFGSTTSIAADAPQEPEDPKRDGAQQTRRDPPAVEPPRTALSDPRLAPILATVRQHVGFAWLGELPEANARGILEQASVDVLKIEDVDDIGHIRAAARALYIPSTELNRVSARDLSVAWKRGTIPFTVVNRESARVPVGVVTAALGRLRLCGVATEADSAVVAGLLLCAMDFGDGSVLGALERAAALHEGLTVSREFPESADLLQIVRSPPGYATSLNAPWRSRISDLSAIVSGHVSYGRLPVTIRLHPSAPSFVAAGITAALGGELQYCLPWDGPVLIIGVEDVALPELRDFLASSPFDSAVERVLFPDRVMGGDEAEAPEGAQ